METLSFIPIVLNATSPAAESINDGLFVLINFAFIQLSYLGLSAIIPAFIAPKRQIGFLWSWFFFCTLSIIGGLVITLISRKINLPPPKRSKSTRRIGRILAVISVPFILYFSFTLLNAALGATVIQIDLTEFVTPVYIWLGIFGLGIYISDIGDGRVFNKYYKMYYAQETQKITLQTNILVDRNLNDSSAQNQI